MSPYQPRHGATSLVKQADSAAHPGTADTAGTGGSVDRERAPETSLPTASHPAAPSREAEGCLAVAVRLPVRIVVLLLVLPVRMAWDALVACGRLLNRVLWQPFARAVGTLWRVLVAEPLAWVWRRVLAPVGRGVGVALVWLGKALFVWPWVALWRYVLAPVGRGVVALVRGVGASLGWLGHWLLVVPARWFYRALLTPLGHGIAAVVRAVGAGLGWLGHWLLVVPARWFYRWVLTPLGVALVWLGKALFVWPWVALWRYVLAPVGRGVAAAVRAVGTALAWLGRMLFVVPITALYRFVLTPLGRALAVVAREIGHAVQHAWRAAGHVSRVVFGFLGRMLRWIFVAPVVWVWQHAVRPVGRGVRDNLWRPVAQAVREAGRAVRAAIGAARRSARQTRAEIRRALFGSTPEKERDGLSR
ncbi:hypothetical protein LHJ74_11055 [Streptomyces sp. N2-109]|uniref:Integral membrane protein n=1 Tax=Streptomyces gossypii TaxID=2883101 RepID=A0ABT2JRR5_9ACTN|nr:hypothetical protein [Streptomyces gossypii]MCT2590441.1 hypothetical protein [Streptomyces gossypii]